MHLNVIKYLAYLVVNKDKLDNKQTHVLQLPMNLGYSMYYQSPLPKGGITPKVASQTTVMDIRWLTFMLELGYGRYFFFCPFFIKTAFNPTWKLLKAPNQISF